jgi:hypothetical protein
MIAIQHEMYGADFQQLDIREQHILHCLQVSKSMTCNLALPLQLQKLVECELWPSTTPTTIESYR